MLPDAYHEAWQNREEERQQLQGAMNQLEAKTQAAIEFVYLREIPRQEAAQQIGVSPITVSRYVKRGVNELVSLMKPQRTERLAS
jgi:RNA polymerase sigma-B factor